MIGDLLKVLGLAALFGVVIYMIVTDNPRQAKALAAAEALIDGKPAEVHHLTDKLTGRTIRFASYGHAAIILPDAPPITVEKQ
jgi:hypothetical protein